MPLLKTLEYEVTTLTRERLPKTIAARTRRVYDVLSTIYPLSTYCFHSRAHKTAVDMAGIQDGMHVLEVATGSGEMFRRLVKANRNGKTVGLDLSPRMAARTQKQVRRDYPDAWTECQAVDARYLPFRDASFDAVVCCYLLELLSTEDIFLTLQEFHRVLTRRGTLTLVLIGHNAAMFNRLYRLAGSLAPAFWGRQIDGRLPELIESCDFRITAERELRQSGYPSRVVATRK
ncbi:MAG: methyltransferase domain-containing protein [Acidimicrobiia bacterium]|nr:methyltransferase domain-containing protein [Acidimicrobiia bacterium]